MLSLNIAYKSQNQMHTTAASKLRVVLRARGVVERLIQHEAKLISIEPHPERNKSRNIRA